MVIIWTKNNKADVTCHLPARRMSTHCATCVSTRVFTSWLPFLHPCIPCREMSSGHGTFENGNWETLTPNRVQFNVAYFLNTTKYSCKILLQYVSITTLMSWWRFHVQKSPMCMLWLQFFQHALLAIAGWNYWCGRDYHWNVHFIV